MVKDSKLEERTRGKVGEIEYTVTDSGAAAIDNMVGGNLTEDYHHANGSISHPVTPKSAEELSEIQENTNDKGFNLKDVIGSISDVVSDIFDAGDESKTPPSAPNVNQSKEIER